MLSRSDVGELRICIGLLTILLLAAAPVVWKVDERFSYYLVGGSMATIAYGLLDAFWYKEC